MVVFIIVLLVIVAVMAGFCFYGNLLHHNGEWKSEPFIL